MRRILFISGSRADYGPARRTLLALRADPELELSILVTGMHLDPAHGETWREIEADGFTIAEKVPGRLVGDSLSAMAGSIGMFLFGMSAAIERADPDIVLVLGDRGEQLAGAVAGALQNRMVAHLCGGSISGSIDDSIRHAITKFSHLHLVAFPEHERRVIQMGEPPDNVHVVGLPGGDLRPDMTMSREEICRDYDLPVDQPYVLVIQHSVTHSMQDASRQIEETLEAVVETGLPALLANPNDDAGGRQILGAMEEYARRHPSLRLLEPPRSRERFASIVGHAGVQVGNSSSALVEAMSVPAPVVNIGDRQRGREQLACMINVGYDRREIADAIRTALEDEDYRARLADFSRSRFSRDTATLVTDLLKSADPSCGGKPKRFFDIDVDVDGSER